MGCCDCASILSTLIICALVSLSSGTTEPSHTSDQNRQRLLIGGLFPFSGGWSGGIGCLPAVQMALEAVNNNTDLLPGYKLELMYEDSECKPGLSLSKMYDLLYDNKTKLVLMTGCSSVSTFVAQAAPMWNIIVLSYGSSSPALSDRTRFPTFFRTHPSATLHNPTRLKLFKKYDWKKIATIQQTEEVFTSTIKDLEDRIKQEARSAQGSQIEISVRQSFQTDPMNAVRSLKRQDARIIVGVFYENMARKVFCQAYKEGLYGKRYVWLIIGWYPDGWYMEPDDQIDCTPEQLKIALEGHLTTEVLQYNTEGSKLTDTGITADQFKLDLKGRLKKAMADKKDSNNNDNDNVPLSSLGGFVEAPLAYDAIWALTFALKKTIGNLDRQGRRLEEFSYTDYVIKEAIFTNLMETDFEGVSGRVKFTSTGDRIAQTQIEQMQDGEYIKLGIYNYNEKTLLWNGVDRWPEGGPPPDRTLILSESRTISPAIFYIAASLSALGIVFSLISLVFNLCFMESSLIRNSTPYMNSIITVGCIFALACVPLYGLDGRIVSPQQYTSICQARTWLLAISFTFSYGMMFIKTFYSWRVTMKAKMSKTPLSKIIDPDKENLSTWMIPVCFALLLALDIILLSSWQLIGPLKRHVDEFEAYRPEGEQEADIKYKPLLERCKCDSLNVWQGVFYCYKGVLLVVGLFLAYETRSVKIRTVNDLRFVSMATYNIIVLCLIAVPVTLIIPNQHNASYVFTSVAIILSCYLTVGLIFLPKMVSIWFRRGDADEDEAQLQSLMTHETEKRYEELKTKNDALKKEIADKEKRIRELHSILQQKFSSQLVEERKNSDSAFSEEGSNGDRLPELSDCSNSSKQSVKTTATPNTSSNLTVKVNTDG